MKLAVLWAAAACVAGLHLSCEEYCTCLSSGYRDVEYQPGCDCVYEETELQEKFDDSGIYYEPADYLSLTALIYQQPFYIINPILQSRQKHSTNTTKQSVNTQQGPNTSGFSAEIDINIGNAHLSHKRKEKDIQADHKRESTPIYLDINIEPEDSERSASTDTINAENFKVTEQSLSECADLYTLLYYRRNEDIKHLNTRDPNQLYKYDHLTNRELIKAIDYKCLHISYIFEQSLQEIKEKRPKKVHYYGYQQNNDFKRKNILNTKKHNVDMNTESDFHSSVPFNKDSTNVIEEFNKDKDYIVVINTNTSDENTFNTSPSQASNTIASASNQVTEPFSDTSSQMDAEDVLTIATSRSTEKYPSIYTYTDNEYPYKTENSLLHIASTTTGEYSIPVTSNEEQDLSENRLSNDEVFRTTDIVEYNEKRKQFKEEDVPLVKVITQEFTNNTVHSYVNGTEDINNDDFKDDNSGMSISIEPMSTEFQTIDTDKSKIPTESDIRGNLYFLVNEQQVPARFVQKPNGALHVGIDAITICNKLNHDEENKMEISKLLSILCNCYKSDNCLK